MYTSVRISDECVAEGSTSVDMQKMNDSQRETDASQQDHGGDDEHKNIASDDQVEEISETQDGHHMIVDEQQERGDKENGVAKGEEEDGNLIRSDVKQTKVGNQRSTNVDREHVHGHDQEHGYGDNVTATGNENEQMWVVDQRCYVTDNEIHGDELNQYLPVILSAPRMLTEFIQLPELNVQVNATSNSKQRRKQHRTSSSQAEMNKDINLLSRQTDKVTKSNTLFSTTSNDDGHMPVVDPPYCGFMRSTVTLPPLPQKPATLLPASKQKPSLPLHLPPLEKKVQRQQYQHPHAVGMSQHDYLAILCSNSGGMSNKKRRSSGRNQFEWSNVHPLLQNTHVKSKQDQVKNRGNKSGFQLLPPVDQIASVHFSMFALAQKFHP